MFVRPSLIHCQCGHGRIAGDRLGWDANDGRECRNVIQNNAACTYFGTLADNDISKDLRTCPDQNTAPHFWVTITTVRTSAAERHFLHH